MQAGSRRVERLFILAHPTPRSGRDNGHVRKVRPPLPLGVPDALALRPTGVSLGIYATVTKHALTCPDAVGVERLRRLEGRLAWLKRICRRLLDKPNR